MKRLTFKDIKELGFTIDENVHGVSQFYRIDLDSDTLLDSFSQDNIDSNILESNYDLAETTYSISNGVHEIEVGLTETEVVNFFIDGEYKRYIQ